MASRNMTSNTEAPGTMYRWIERKPLTEAVSWTSREKFWLITAACHFGTHDWKSVAQVVKNAGEQYRPKDWYTSKSCERQFKVLVSNLSKEVKSLPLVDMLQHIAEGLRKDYLRDANKSKDSLKTKYCNLFSVLNRVKQGNLSRNEVVSLYSQARRNEIEGKQYLEQLMTRQNASLASENSSSGLSEETIKWNTPSAPLLTSLLRSRNTIPANRTVTTIASLLQSPGGTSRTRSGKMLPLSSNVRTTSAQGTPTLSKLLEAPANPYLSSPPLSTQKNKPSEVSGTDKLVGNTSRKENSLSTSLNKVRVENVNTSGSCNQINKTDLSTPKKQTPKSPVSAVKSGSKSNSNIVSLLSDSDDDDEENCKSSVQNTNPKEKKDSNIISRIEPRATRSQTRAEGSFKQLNDGKLSDGKKERDTLRQENGGSQLSETHHSIEDDLIDIDQIEVEPLSSVQDEMITQTPSKVTRSSVQRSLVNTTAENLLSTNKVKSKEISNQMLEEISANFVLNSSLKNVATEYKNVMVGRSRIDNANISGCIVPIGGSAAKETIIVRKDGQSFPSPVNMVTTFDGKILKQKRIIDLKGANIKCIDGKLSFASPVVLLKKPFNIKLASELKNKTDDVQLKNNDPKKTIRINNISQNLIQLLDANQSLSNDDVTLGKDVHINVDDKTATKINKLSSKESLNLPLTTVSSNDSSNVSVVSKSTSLQINEKKTKNDKTMFNVFGKPQNLPIIPSKKSGHQDSVPKIEINSNISEPNRYIKELDFDFDQSISQTSLSELYNGVEEIVEMHSFDNEELNSLIECDSLDNSETEEPQNTIIIDHGDSSVSESDSTIGAFDTFAQITGVPPKSSSSKDTKAIVKEPKILKQGGKDLEHDEGFVQSDEIDDDQSSSAVSVTGIPVLQNVISDVMSKIDSDRNAALSKAVDKSKQLNDASEIIELISSDEEEKSDDDESNQQSTNANETNNTIDSDIDLKTKKLKLDVFSVHQINEEKNNKCKSSTEIQIVKAGMENVDGDVQSRVHNIIKTFVDKKLIDARNRINLESADPKNKNIHLNALKNALLYAKANRENDKKEVKKNEAETKVPSINETTINSKEILTSRISNEKYQEAIKNVKDPNEKLQNEDIEKNKKEEEKKVKDVEIIEVEQIKEYESEVVKRAKEVEKKEFEAEIMQRGKKIQVKKGKVPDMTKIIETEIKTTKEIEIEKEKDIEMKKAKELEMKKAKEIEIKEMEMIKAKEVEMGKAKEIEMQKFKEIEMKNAKENELRKAKEIEARETATQKAQEIELQKAKEAQIQRIKDDEIQQAKETEILRIKEAELMKEAEMKKAKETAMSLKAREEEIFVLARDAEEFRSRQAALLKSKEMQIVKLAQQDLELQRQRENQKKLVNEAETNKKIGEELRKGIEETLKNFEETELKKSRDETDMMKTKETESKETKSIELKEKDEKNNVTKGAELKKIKEMEAKEAQLKKTKETEMKMRIVEVQVQLQREEVDDQSKKTNKSDQSTSEVKKVNDEKTGVKESDMETIKSKEEASKSNKSTEIEGKKVKEIKEVENKINTRNRGSKTEEKLKDSCSVSKNVSIKSTTASKSLETLSSMMSSTTQAKNICDEDKHIDDINKCDRDLSTKYEVSGKSRTRSSSSFKKNTSNDIPTSLHKSNDKSEDVILKKRRILSSSHSEIPSSSVNLQRNTEISRREALSKAITENNLGKQLTVPLVKISTNRKPYYSENVQSSDNDSVKQPVVSIEQITIDANEIIEKPAPKKRGRKRRINIQMANSDQQDLQNGATINTSSSMSKEMEPLAKRTRRSVETRESKKEETVSKSSDITNLKNNCLKYFYKMINDKSNFHLSIIQKEVVKDLPPEINRIIKSPVYLHDIEKKINSGEITNIPNFVFNLMIMGYNALMINRSDSAIYDDVSNFLDYLQSEYQARFRKSDIEKEGKRVVQGSAGINEIECITIDDDENDTAGDVQSENETKKYIRYTRSNKESSSDSESDRVLPPKKRKKKNAYYRDPSAIDTDFYDSDLIMSS